MHELTKNIVNIVLPDKKYDSRIDKVIRKWLDEKAKYMSQYSHTNFCKEFLHKHLGLTPDPVEELADLLEDISSKYSATSHTGVSYKTLAKEAIKWMEEKKCQEYHLDQKTHTK
jgi:hypothetical protein